MMYLPKHIRIEIVCARGQSIFTLVSNQSFQKYEKQEQNAQMCSHCRCKLMYGRTVLSTYGSFDLSLDSLRPFVAVANRLIDFRFLSSAARRKIDCSTTTHLERKYSFRTTTYLAFFSSSRLVRLLRIAD
jgi:hypothetical protein